MKAKIFGAAASAAIMAGSISFPVSPAAASTVPVNYSYAYFATGPHQRQPRTISGSGFTIISSQSGGQSSTGLMFTTSEQPEYQPPNGQTYKFAFVTVTGGSATPGGPLVGVTSTESDKPVSVVVGTQPINVLVVYTPVGGGPGESGATIDAFDETTGTLFDDTFVTVSPDPGGTLTKSGNVFGFVPTANAEAITALSPTSPTGVNFSKWLTLGSTTPDMSTLLKVGSGVSLSALAFYDAPPPAPPSSPKAVCQNEAESLQKIIDDHGPLLLAATFAQVKAALEKCVSEGYLSQAEVSELVKEYQNIGSTQNGPSLPKGP
jgi:hypothetical protein